MEKNFVFLGEAGCGKSEIAISLAEKLAAEGNKQVHFFDMDQTKPLFRSRDAKERLRAAGIVCHFEVQYMDAPTLVGGVMPCLRDPDCAVVMDVGGDDIGARMIGGFARVLNGPETKVYYVVNWYLPWSGDILAVDGTLSEILKVSRIRDFHMIANPNVGAETTAEEFLTGLQKTVEMISPYKEIEAACVREELLPEVRGKTDVPLFPVRLALTYPWLKEE